MKKNILILLLCFPMLSWAQNILGKVTKEELQEQKSDKFPQADAVILDEYGSIHFDYHVGIGFQMVQKTSRKIKVYTQDGIDNVNLSVTYYVGRNVKENLKIDEMTTYNLEDNRIVKTKAKSSALFEDNKDKYWKQKTMIAPDVKPGSIVEYSYTLRTDHLNEIPAWDFQKSIPTLNSVYRLRIPEYLVYSTRIKGGQSVKRENDIKHSSIRLSNSVPSQEIKLLENILVYTATDIDQLKDENYIDNKENYRSTVSFDLSLIQYPGQPSKSIGLTTEDLVKNIYNSSNFKNQLEQTKYFVPSINLSEYQGLNDIQKTQKILDLVKSSVSWNNQNGYLTRNGVKAAFENKTGNVAEINLMLTSMLRYVGLKANPVLVSTVANGIDISMQRTSFNRVISSVKIGDATLFLDATNPYTAINIIPTSDLNWSGILIEEEDKFELLEMMPNFYSTKSENFQVQLNRDGTVSGQAMLTYKDYYAYIYRNNYKDKSEQELQNQLEKSYNNTQIKSIRPNSLEDTTKDFRVLFTFEKSDMYARIGDEIYFNPMQFYNKNSNPFTAVKRDMPIFLGFPSIEAYQFTLVVPQDLEIEYLPESLVIEDPEIGLKADYSLVQDGHKVTINLVLTTSLHKVEPEHYELVKSFYQKLVDKVGDRIILKTT